MCYPLKKIITRAPPQKFFPLLPPCQTESKFQGP